MKKKLVIVSAVIASVLLSACSGGSDSSSGGAQPTPTPSAKFDPDGRADNGGSGVMLQGFTWSSPTTSQYWYSNISANAADIKDTFEYVWYPPVSDSSDPTGNGYLPRKLNQLYQSVTPENPNPNGYGTEEELRQSIIDIKPAKAIADVVINHRCGTTSWGDFTEPSFGEDFAAICGDDEGFSSKLSGMYGARLYGADDTGEKYSAGRDLDHTNSTVQKGIVTWMNSVLKDAGFVGWRYDYVKGYGSRYPGYYNAKTAPEFSVGEYWPTNGFTGAAPYGWSKLISDWIEGTSATTNGTAGKTSRAFDFVLKGMMNEVFGCLNSKYTASDEIPDGYAVGDYIPTANDHYDYLAHAANIYKKLPGYAVTFVDNHDTGSTQAHWYLDPNDVGAAYAFTLTHPGYPSVAWYHYFAKEDCPSDSQNQYFGGKIVPGTSVTYKNFIKSLIALRKEAGITDLSEVETLVAERSQYVGKVTGTAKTLVVALGASYDCPQGYSEEISGDGFQIYSIDTSVSE